MRKTLDPCNEISALPLTDKGQKRRSLLSQQVHAQSLDREEEEGLLDRLMWGFKGAGERKLPRDVFAAWLDIRRGAGKQYLIAVPNARNGKGSIFEVVG